MLKTLSTFALVLGLAATGCSKKKDAPAGDKPATTEAAKPTENKAGEAPKTEEAKAAPAAAPAGDVKIASDDEYLTTGKAAIAQMTEVFKSAGTDCAKLAAEFTKMASDPKFVASQAYEKEHPEIKKKFEESAKAETEAFMAAAGPAIQGCMEDKAFAEALQKLGD